jgi:diguanylate cyclase (GGDEF)-like protein
MLQALSRIVGIGHEHFSLLAVYAPRLFSRRDALAQKIFAYLIKLDRQAPFSDLPASADALLEGLESTLLHPPGHGRPGPGAMVFRPEWSRAYSSGVLYGGLSECLTQIMLDEVAAQDLGPMVRFALSEAVRKRILLDWMLNLQQVLPEREDIRGVDARLYATLSSVSLALLHTSDRTRLFQEICSICVGQGGFSHAWIGWMHPGSSVLEHQAIAGECAADFVPAILVDPKGPSPSARAVTSQQSQVLNDLEQDPTIERWMPLLRKADVHSMLSTPLLVRGQALGVLVLYARPASYFVPEIVGLVETMAGEIGHALDRLDALERSLKAETELAFLTQHDLLTGLPNRQLMLDSIHQSLELAPADGRIAVIALAIDGFHEINARLGHASGDVLLREVALRMSQTVLPAGTVGRFGAARFVACLEGGEVVGRVVASLMEAMQQPIDCHGEAVSLKCSIGVVEEDVDAAVATTLLRCSDLALIRAREAGGGRCCFYDAAMDIEINRQHSQRQEFSRAVERGELELLYQPKIDLLTHKISGVEALVRWRKDGALMPPGEFFPAIEHTDLMCELDWWVMEEALRHYSVWMAQGKLIPVSVNLSSATLRNENFLARLQALIMRYPMPDGHLELEVLETISQKEAEEIVHKLERCREFGVSIALDDFGTGASSLVHLQQLPFDTIKIDQRFARKLLKAPGNEAIIRSMISFAQYSGRKLVVEGVESRPIWDRLLEIGCSSGQGYAISPPISSAQLMTWLAGRELRAAA